MTSSSGLSVTDKREFSRLITSLMLYYLCEFAPFSSSRAEAFTQNTNTCILWYIQCFCQNWEIKSSLQQNLSLTRLLLWQIFTNFQIFQDTFRSNKPHTCLGLPINASTDILILDAYQHIKRAVCSSCPRKMSNSLSSIPRDVSAQVPRLGACTAAGVRFSLQKFECMFGRASRLNCWRS